MENEYLDFDEAVKFLKTTPSTLYKWLQAGKIPGHKLGRQWRFLKDELEIHLSGKGSKIQTQKDFLSLFEKLNNRSSSKEFKMNLQPFNLSEQIIWDAFDHGSRIIHVYPTNGKYEIAYRTNLGMNKFTTLQEESFRQLHSGILENSVAIGNEDSRRFFVHREENSMLQVNYQEITTVSGTHVTLHLWQSEKDALSLEKISSTVRSLEQFKSWLNYDSGLFIVTGASGSGKTTTMYSLMNEFKKKNNVVFTIEDSANLIIDGIHQIELKSKSPLAFQEICQKVYKMDPDVICLGFGSNTGLEKELYSFAVDAASTGHVVILQMGLGSCTNAINEIKRFVSTDFSDALRGVCHQKLISENNRLKVIYDFL